MTGSCPILFENKQEEYGLTDKEVAEHTKRVNKRKKL